MTGYHRLAVPTNVTRRRVIHCVIIAIYKRDHRVVRERDSPKESRDKILSSDVDLQPDDVAVAPGRPRALLRLCKEIREREIKTLF